jgi:hypothetical protein
MSRPVGFMRRHVTTLLAVGFVALTCGTIINYVLIAQALQRTTQQANAGQNARQTQCDREPVIKKLGLAAYAVRASLPDESQVTREELARFLAQSPKGCPR